MKRLVRTLMVLLIVAVGIAGLRMYFVLRPKEVPEEKVRETLKHFTFSSVKDLNEWDEKLLSKENTDYSVTESDGKQCVKAVSHNSASSLYYQQRLSCDDNPFVSWDWKAEKFPVRKKKESLRKKDEFDFVAQVYVVFYARFFLNMKAIQYVWTRDIPAGTSADSPYTSKVKILVLESGESE